MKPTHLISMSIPPTIHVQMKKLPLLLLLLLAFTRDVLGQVVSNHNIRSSMKFLDTEYVTEDITTDMSDGLDTVACVQNCMRQFDSLVLNSDQLSEQEVCSTWNTVRTCLSSSCDNGDRMLARIERLTPRSIALLRETCDHPRLSLPTGALPTDATAHHLSTVPVNQELLESLVAEDARANAMERCVTSCERHLNTLASNLVARGGGNGSAAGAAADSGRQQQLSLDTVCSTWDQFSSCISACPSGDEAFALAREMIPGIMTQIDTQCGGAAHPSGSSIHGNSVLPGPVRGQHQHGNLAMGEVGGQANSVDGEDYLAQKENGVDGQQYNYDNYDNAMSDPRITMVSGAQGVHRWLRSLPLAQLPLVLSIFSLFYL